MEANEKASIEEVKEVADMLSKLPNEERKVAKGYISALVDIQEMRERKEAVQEGGSGNEHNNRFNIHASDYGICVYKMLANIEIPKNLSE